VFYNDGSTSTQDEIPLFVPKVSYSCTHICKYFLKVSDIMTDINSLYVFEVFIYSVFSVFTFHKLLCVKFYELCCELLFSLKIFNE